VRPDPAEAAVAADASVRGPRRLAALLGLAVTATLVVVALRKIEPGDVLEALRASSLVWILPALGALALATLLRALRWRFLFVPETRPAPRPVLASMLVGDLFNNVLPLRAGEAARILALHARSRVSRAQIGATVVLERLFDVALLLLLLVAALPWLPEVTWLRAAAWLGAAVGVGAAVLVVLLAAFGDRPVQLLLRPLRRLPFLSAERWEQAPANVTRGLAGLRRPRVAFQALALTAAAWGAGICSAWLLMFGFDLELGPSAAVLVVVATALGMGLPSAPAALGVFEAATVVALAAYGIPAAHALSYALVLHAVSFVPLVTAGLLVLAFGSARPGAASPRPSGGKLGRFAPSVFRRN
jgi:uncharacterized protein (TIRG00374 family)